MPRAAFLLGAATLLVGCSTDLDINAPYKDITIVHGLLDMRDSVQYVKISKAFLGEGDAYHYAQIQDSNEWDPGVIDHARVVRKLNGNVVGTFDLQRTTVTNRQPGTFYSPEQSLYYFVDPFEADIQLGGVSTTMHLDWNSEYEIQLRVKGEDITATTNIVNNFSFGPGIQTSGNVLNLHNGTNYDHYSLRWSSNLDGKRYVAEYTFNYKEVTGTDTVDRHFTRSLGSRISNNPSATGQAMSVELDGAEFFSAVASDAGGRIVDQRLFTGIDLSVAVANDELHTYLTLNEPITGIVQDRPSYSNVTNGYGIWGSRYTRQITRNSLNGNSLIQLCTGPITGTLRYCSAMPADVTSSHYCP